MRISVVCTAAEYRVIKAKAGLVPLSRWVKSLALSKPAGVKPKHPRQRP